MSPSAKLVTRAEVSGWMLLECLDRATVERLLKTIEAAARIAELVEALKQYEQASPVTPRTAETTPCFCAMWPHTDRCLRSRAALAKVGTS